MILAHAKHHKISLFIYVVIGVAGLAVLNLATNSVNAAVNLGAFSNELTNKSDVKAGGTNGAVDLHIKNVAGIATIPENSLAAYFPSSIENTKGLVLEIQDGRKGRVCSINANVATGNILVQIKTKTKTVEHIVSVKDICSTNKFFGKKLNFPNDEPRRQKDVGLGRADITVRFTGPPRSAADLEGTDKFSLNYNLRLSGTNSGKVKLASKSEDSSGNPLDIGLRSSYQGRYESASSREVQARTVFGWPCDVDPSSLTTIQRSVSLFDADAGFGDTFLWVEKDGTPLQENDYAYGQSVKIKEWNNFRKAWLVQSTNEAYSHLAIKPSAIDVRSQYRVYVLNTGRVDGSNSSLNPHGNTLSIRIPFDSIYGSGKCDYSLEPSVNPPANSTETYVENSIIPVTGRVTVDGFDTDNHDWSLSVRVFDNKPNDRAQRVNGNSPCSWGGGFKTCQDNFASGTRKFDENFSVSRNFDSTGIEAGDWVCFMMSVKKPSYGAPNGRWKHSVIKCVGIRGDVSGTTVNPDRYSYYHDIDITSIADNLNDYPKIDTFAGEDYKRRYPWQIIEAKFTQMPTSSIGEATNDDACATIQSNFSSTLIAGSCKDNIGQGDDLFPNNNAKQTVTASSEKDTPDPIGTWTCYTMRYRNNPRPINALESDIDTYVADHNDDNSSSSSSRWSDGYSFEHYHDTSYIDPESGELVSDGFTHAHGSQISKSSIWNPYLAGTSPARYTYTSYERTSCSVAGIWPKVQIQAGDLRVAGDIAATATSIAPPAQYRAMYGSFGEYGVLSQSGLVTGMASGAGFNSGENLGSSQFDWSALTFSNNSGTEYGNSGIQAVHSFNYTNPIEIDGDLTVSSINDLYTPESRRHVYVVNGNVYITGNLAYSNNYNTTEQLPKIAIKANNIIVAPGVDRIDPWLIADDVLNTCGDATFDTEAASLADAGLVTTNAHNSACDNNGVPLVFNGPVIAGRVFLLRTTGSRDSFPASSADGKRTLSQPAEIFNLRPDAFLSSFSNNVTPNPVAVTDRVIDLPPRF